MFKRLSYLIDKEAPGWPGSPRVELESCGSIAEGDMANTYNIKLFNHFSSHLDAPKHFNDQGKKITELPLETFIYTRPLLLDIPKSYEELITVDDLLPYEEELKKADLLMVRSGFSINRKEQPERYAAEGPGVSSEAAKFLVEKYDNLKAIAIDWVSLASYPNDDGQLAHQYMLGKYTDNYICIIEDLNLVGIEQNELERIYALPLLVKGVDSSAVTVIAELKEGDE